MISPPTARDAAGNTVPSELTVDGDTVTLTVSTSAASVYPVSVQTQVVGTSSNGALARTGGMSYGLSDRDLEYFKRA